MERFKLVCIPVTSFWYPNLKRINHFYHPFCNVMKEVIPSIFNCLSCQWNSQDHSLKSPLHNTALEIADIKTWFDLKKKMDIFSRADGGDTVKAGPEWWHSCDVQVTLPDFKWISFSFRVYIILCCIEQWLECLNEVKLERNRWFYMKNRFRTNWSAASIGTLFVDHDVLGGEVMCEGNKSPVLN